MIRNRLGKIVTNIEKRILILAEYSYRIGNMMLRLLRIMLIMIYLQLTHLFQDGSRYSYNSPNSIFIRYHNRWKGIRKNC